MKTPVQNPPQELHNASTKSHQVYTHDTFEGQYKQRKKRRLEQTKQEGHQDGSSQINGNSPKKDSISRPNKKHPTEARNLAQSEAKLAKVHVIEGQITHSTVSKPDDFNP